MHPQSVSGELKYVFTFGHTNLSSLCRRTYFSCVYNESWSVCSWCRTHSVAFLTYTTATQTSAAPRTDWISCQWWGHVHVAVTPEDIGGAVTACTSLPLLSPAPWICSVRVEIGARASVSTVSWNSLKAVCLRPRVSSQYECLWMPCLWFRSL